MSDPRPKKPLGEKSRKKLIGELTESWKRWKARGRPHDDLQSWLIRRHDRFRNRILRHLDELESDLPQALREDWGGAHPKEGSWGRRRRKRHEVIARSLLALWEEWKTAGKPGKYLWPWVYEHHRDVDRAFDRNCEVRDMLPKEFLDEWVQPLVFRERGIGERTLARFMPQLAARFLQQQLLYGTRGFDAWCTTILRRYPSVRRLREFLTD